MIQQSLFPDTPDNNIYSCDNCGRRIDTDIELCWECNTDKIAEELSQELYDGILKDMIIGNIIYSIRGR